MFYIYSASLLDWCVLGYTADYINFTLNKISALTLRMVKRIIADIGSHDENEAESMTHQIIRRAWISEPLQPEHVMLTNHRVARYMLSLWIMPSS